MSRMTKDDAKEYVRLYGDLLIDRAIIGSIEKKEKRGIICYEFQTCGKFPVLVSCADIKELASVLAAMWETYQMTRQQLGCYDQEDDLEEVSI